MSTITHKFTHPAAGGRVGSVGSLIWTPTKRRQLEGETVLPEGFTKPLESDGTIEVDVDDTSDDWGWCVIEDIPRGRTRFVLVAGDADYADLEEFDPGSGEIKPPLPPVWKSYVDSAIATAVAAVQLVIATLTGRVTVAETAIGTKASQADLISEGALRAAADATKANQADLTAGLATKASQADLTAGLATKANQADLTAGLATKQPLATMLTKIAALAGTLTEGQLIKWDATLGEPVAANPVGAGRIAAAVNATGVVTTLPPGGAGGAGAVQTIASTAISVTNSNGRPVVIRFGASFEQTVAGLGAVFLTLRETTGAGADRKLCVQPLTGAATVGNSYVTCADEVDIGAVTTTRTFELRAGLYTPAASTPTARAFNSPTAPSWVRADAA